MLYYEVSAKAGTNVLSSFETLVAEAVRDCHDHCHDHSSFAEVDC